MQKVDEEKEQNYERTSFYLRNLIEAYRIQRSDDLIGDAKNLLLKHSKPTIYKYLAILGPYGYKYINLINVWNHYVVEFLNDIEFPVNNIIRYFKGFLNHQFYKIIDHETTNTRKNNSLNLSLDNLIPEIEGNCFYLDAIKSDEDISNWYSWRDLIDNYIRDEKQKYLSDPEKKIIDLRIDGNTFCEISNLIGLTYKQVVYFYDKAINKLKKLIFGERNSLQNSTIF